MFDGRLMLALALASALLPVVAMAGDSASVQRTALPTANADVPAPMAIETTRWGDKHLFQVSYASIPSPVPLLSVHAWTLTVVDAKARPVDAATISVVGAMPAHDHGLPTRPEVKALGGGHYLVEGMKFHMPGAWVVVFTVKAGDATDSVRFALDLR